MWHTNGMNIQIKKLHPDVTLPAYETLHSAGLDIRAYIKEPVLLLPMERVAIPTGFSMAIPEGYEVQIRARSGLAAKHGIALTNGIGTIDADYRGEFKILLINLGQESFTIEPGMRIAQMVVAAYTHAEWEEAEELSETIRGEGGHGSTGL